MSYVVLARKWRPMRFEDLVGQEHVARTLAGAIASGRVAHAFLFTGVRGVGKTTSARILAKALNCMREPGSVPAGTDPGPTATPCLKCPACLEIAAGNDVDVREIDGASYNGVDEVRRLQDSLPYRPSRDRYKIFIIDEVHMLSQSAWNAFLKTLEEPPPHVKFIFATTEVHKVPVTILSRVQRFDFKLIATRLIAERLRDVLREEGIAADEQAVSIIAREAAGSMRDAMSLLDQVIAWSSDKLGGDDVARVLGVASRQVLHDVATALLDGDPARCLQVVSELASQGYDMPHVARDLLALLRDLVVAKVCSDPGDLLDLADEEKRDVVELAARSDTDDLVRLHQGFSQSFDDVARSGQPRAGLEMLLVRLARRPPLIPIDHLVARLGALERRLGGGREAPERARAPTRADQPGAPPARSRARETESRGAPPAPPASGRDEPPPVAAAAPTSSPEPVVVPQPPAAPPSAPKPFAVDAPTLATWQSMLERIAEARPELAAIFEHAVILELGPQRIVVGSVPGDVFARELGAAEARRALESAAAAHFEAPVKVELELDSERARSFETLAARYARERDERSREAIAEVKQHPRVADAIEILGARVKDVKLASS
jgi:DNA polymerase III subunit gamma/tau